MAKPDKRKALRLLGFSPIQASVYLTLVKLGKTDAKTLAQHSNTSYVATIKILDDFQKLGIAQKTLDDLSKFKANPIEHSLPTLITSKIRQEKMVLDNTIDLAPESKQKLIFDKRLFGLGSNMSLIPSTEIALKKRSELIKTAQESIDVISTWQNYRFLLKSNFNRKTKDAVDRNVKYRFMVETPKNVKLPAEHLEALKIIEKNCSEFRYLPVGSSVIMTIYDARQVFLSTNPDLGPFNSPMLWSNNDPFILIGKNYFENLWKTASKQPTTSKQV